MRITNDFDLQTEWRLLEFQASTKKWMHLTFLMGISTLKDGRKATRDKIFV